MSALSPLLYTFSDNYVSSRC